MNLRKLLRTLKILIFCVCLNPLEAAIAEESNNKNINEKSNDSFYLKAFGGINLLRNTDLESTGSSQLPEGKASYDSGIDVGLALGYKLIDEIGVEIEYSYRSNDIKKISNESGTFARSGDLASVAIMGNLLYYPQISKSVIPYIGAGIGFLQEIDADISLSSGENIKDLEDSVLALQLIAGIEIPIFSSLSIIGEGRYLASPNPELSNRNQAYDLDYNSFSTNVGVKYSF